MKYTCTIEIDLPLNKTVELWEDESNFKEWQDGFISIEHIEGIPNTNGAKSRILLEGKQKMELIETIIKADLPRGKLAQYDHIHMTNTQCSRFEKITENRTRYISEVEYTRFHSFMPKLMAKLFPKMFQKQSQKWMDQFKEFAENASR